MADKRGSAEVARIQAAIRDVPDFPKPGIVFKDITPLLLDSELVRLAVRRMADPFRSLGITRVVAVESRGFLLGAPVALELGAGIVPIRKPGKLPTAKDRVEYALEYGTDALEMHQDAIGAADRVLVVDDVLATGGTAAACGQLIAGRGGALVGYSFLIELSFLNGRAKLAGRRVEALLRYG